MRADWALSGLRCGEDAALLALRVGIGAFLVYGVWDNIVAPEHMQELVDFLDKFGFAAPAPMARLSVWAQFAIGISFMLGLFTRWAGLLCVVNFTVAIVMVDRFAGIRGAFPSLCLVLIGAYLITRGAGQFAVDRWLEDREPRNIAGD